MNNRFNVPSYMGQQPMRFSPQGHGGGCRVGHFSPSQPVHYSAVSAPVNQAIPNPTPAPAKAPEQVDTRECKPNPAVIVAAASAMASTGAIAGSKTGTMLGVVGGFVGGGAIGAVGGMVRDSIKVQECLDAKKPKPSPKP